MQKLVDNWIENPTEQNAKRIAKHVQKRPFSVLTLGRDDHDAMQRALASLEPAYF
jgi:hypothetical protein